MQIRIGWGVRNDARDMECDARLDIGTPNYPAIIKCQLKAKHKGRHKEVFTTQYPQDKKPMPATITWK